MILHMKKAERDYARAGTLLQQSSSAAADTKFSPSAVKEDRVSLWYLFEIAVAKHPNTTCLWSREGIYTWTETRTLAIQYAQWFLSQGVKPGELVAFYLTNSPELMIAWLGLWCIGCAPAFINYNLEGAALEHCLKVSEAKLLLVDQDESCRQRVERRRDHIETQLGMRIYVLDALLKTSISKMPNNFPPDSYRSGIQGSSPLCLIYTSGTTGLPKGCAFTIQRLRLTGVHLAPPFDTKCGPDGDRWYVCMPLYHGTGGIYAASLMCQGVSLAIGKRFSVSNFWKDIHDSQATFFVYVGETARYLLNAPPDPLERAHRLRCVSGNGLRPDVWERFRTRFGIQEIAEFFNSTEGMFAMLNWDRGGWFGACVGHHGLISAQFCIINTSLS